VERLVERFATGEEATIDFDNNVIINETTGARFELKSLGDVRPVIDAGGLFDYARQTGMIPVKA
jgi:3-isopropylmalate/(R)-2-methylmalate dehydratase small subunit